MFVSELLTRKGRSGAEATAENGLSKRLVGGGLSVTLLLGMVLQAGATVIVHDPVMNAMSQYNWITTETKQALQYEKQLEQAIAEHTTALKEVQQVENEIVQLERMGDPKAYGVNLPGVGAITGLARIYQQGQQDLGDWQAYSNPGSFKLTAEQVMGQYANSLNGFDSRGRAISPTQGLVQFSLSDYNVASGAQDSIGKLIQTKNDLTQARDEAIAQMKKAHDQSEVQKDQAIITSLNGAIAGVDGSIQQAATIAFQQEQKDRAAENIYRAGIVVQSAGGFSDEVRSSMDSLQKVAPRDDVLPHWDQ